MCFKVSENKIINGWSFLFFYSSFSSFISSRLDKIDSCIFLYFFLEYHIINATNKNTHVKNIHSEKDAFVSAERSVVISVRQVQLSVNVCVVFATVPLVMENTVGKHGSVQLRIRITFGKYPTPRIVT
jgi:hypothetical protein